MKNILLNPKFNILNKLFIRDKLKKIKLIVTDVDGVLTDGGIFIDENNNKSRKFNVKDGLGIKIIQELKIIVAFISGGSGESIIQRARDLKIKYCFTEVKDKEEAIIQLKQTLKIKIDNIAYIGDDINDISVRKHVNLLIATNDSMKQLKLVSDLILRNKGGEGAFREFVDILLKANNQYIKYKNGWKNLN